MNDAPYFSKDLISLNSKPYLVRLSIIKLRYPLSTPSPFLGSLSILKAKPGGSGINSILSGNSVSLHA